MWVMGPKSFFCVWLFGCPRTACWKDYSFSVELSWHPCKKNQLNINAWIYFWTLASIPFIYMSVLRIVPHNLDSYSFIKWWNQEACLPTLFLFFKIFLGILGPSHFHLNFLISLSTLYVKKPAGILIGITINLQINLEMLCLKNTVFQSRNKGYHFSFLGLL